MFVAGCDVGSLTTKVVIKDENQILSYSIIRSRIKPELCSQQALEEALQKAKLSLSDLAYVVGTGYGREKISFVQETISEITCHTRGAHWLLPGIQTVIDIGGQDCKAIRLDSSGGVEKFVANDKCASGTGRFLEVMAKVLGVSIDDLGELSNKSKSPITLASTCTVWSQADVIKYLNSGTSIEDIGAGINNAMAARVAILARSVGVGGQVCMTGGVAKNQGVVKALEKLLNTRIKKLRRADPQIIGALGAALIAQDKQNP